MKDNMLHRRATSDVPHPTARTSSGRPLAYRVCHEASIGKEASS